MRCSAVSQEVFLRLLLLAGVLGLCPACRPAQAPPSATPPVEVIKTSTGADMVLIPAGKFVMGSSAGQADEQPEHEVRIDAFLMDRTEVTQAQHDKLVRPNPSHFKGPNSPVEMISWAEAALYCNLRSRAEGLEPCYDEQTAKCNFEANGYRLPTEAEWEYACRAGSQSEYGFGSDPRSLKDHAWYAENSAKKTHAVAEKRPNAWGLFDMHGNVAEWCNDVYGPDYYKSSPAENPRGPDDGERYVLRGGAWNCRERLCRSSARAGEDPGFQDACFARDAIGFRCVRRVPKLQPPKPREDTRSEPGSAKYPPESRSGDRRSAVSTGSETRAEREEETRAERDMPSQPQSAIPNSQSKIQNPKFKIQKTGFVYSDAFLSHTTGEGHPERPERLTAIVNRLDQTGMRAQLVRIEPVAATREWLTALHSPAYVDRVERSCREPAAYVDSPDTPVSKGTYQAALLAAGGAMAAVDAVMAGTVRNAFCAVRPPGHHALRDRAMGFCLFGNIAIAARYVQRKHKLPRVLIVDWDVHHGNGTQSFFDDDPTVFYFSAHRSPFYPGTGHAEDRGSGAAAGTKLNVPLPAGSAGAAYEKAFVEQLRPAAISFQPDFVFISAGFDAHADDPLGGMRLTAGDYGRLTAVVKDIAARSCRGRLVSVLEGGYSLEGIAASVEAHLRELMK